MLCSEFFCCAPLALRKVLAAAGVHALVSFSLAGSGAQLLPFNEGYSVTDATFWIPLIVHGQGSTLSGLFPSHTRISLKACQRSFILGILSLRSL